MLRLFVSLLSLAALAAITFITNAAPAPGQWEPDRRVTGDTTGAGQQEVTLAINPLNNDNAIAVYKDYRAGTRNYLSVSQDGGLTWAERLFPRPTPDLPTDTDPAVFFRRDGRAYLLWTSSSDFSHGGLFTAWSDDGGQTWGPVAVVTPPEGYTDDKAWLTFDTTGGPGDGTLHATWVRFGLAEIYAARSTDGGTTWSSPVIISSGATRSDNDGPLPFVLPDGTLLVLFLHSNPSGQPSRLVAVRSTDGGATFGPNTILFPIVPAPYVLPGENWRIFTYLSIVRDPVRGWLTAVWPDYRDGPTEGINILLARSTDAGFTWSAPERLNDDPPGLVRDQMFPALAAAPDGGLAALWLDRRASADNRLYVATARRSTDGGLTWAASEAVSSAPSDPGVNIPPGSDGIGDYIGLGAGPGVFWGAWVDTRNGNQDIYAARVRFTPQALPTPSATATVTPGATITATAPPNLTATATASLTSSPIVTTTPTPSTLTPTPTITPCLPLFADVPDSNPFYSYVQWLACRGYVNGYSCGGPGELCDPQGHPYYRPGATITRGQLLKVLVNAAGWPLATPPTPTFADVPPTHPFYIYIETGAERGVISGYGCGGLGEPCDEINRPYFRPYAAITRGQLSKVIALARSYPLPTPTIPNFNDVPATHPSALYIEAIAAQGIVSGYGCGGPGEPCDPPLNRPYFRPYNSATRAQVAKFVTLAYGGP